MDKRQKLQSAFADDAVAITKVVIDKALAGDMVAASNALARIAPPLRARAERVQFTLTDGTPLSAQARQILQAVAEGRLDAGTAKVLIGCIQAVSGIRAVEDVESRPALLEARTVN